jgi:hypothetical protein
MMLERFSYRGWQNAYKVSNGVVELTRPRMSAPESFFTAFAGARTCFMRSKRTRARLVVRSFAPYGGHRLWVAPEVETTYYPDNAPVQAAEHGNAVRFTAPREAQPLGTNLQKELEIELG